MPRYAINDELSFKYPSGCTVQPRFKGRGFRLDFQDAVPERDRGVARALLVLEPADELTGCMCRVAAAAAVAAEQQLAAGLQAGDGSLAERLQGRGALREEALLGRDARFDGRADLGVVHVSTANVSRASRSMHGRERGADLVAGMNTEDDRRRDVEGIDDVITAAPIDYVVAGTTDNRVRTLAAGDCVVSGSTVQLTMFQS